MDELTRLIEDSPSIGHNLPPLMQIDDKGKFALDDGALTDWLRSESESVVERATELLGAVSRCPPTISDEDIAHKAADLVKMLTACTKTAELLRVGYKEPFLAGGRLVDGAFHKITDPLDKAKSDVSRRLTAYQRVVAEAERRRREEEERRQREEAVRKAREAEEAANKLRTEEDLAKAIAAEEAAQQARADAAQAEKAADAKPAELSRTRSELGSVASLRTFWDFRDLDRHQIDLDTLRPYLAVDAIEKALRLFIRSGGRKIAGAEIFENTATSVR